MSYVSLTGDPQYASLTADLRVNVPSGMLSLGDGTTGGVPVSGGSYGIPSAGIIDWTSTPSGVQGDSLQAMMNQFPRYTRIRWDPTSMGAQFLTAASRTVDEALHARTMTSRSQFPATYPLYEQGVVYEWDHNTASGLELLPAVSGRLGDNWFAIPVAQDELTFWTSPPTRLETTTAEISGITLLDWTQIGASGLKDLITTEVDLPLHNQIVVEVSGARYFDFTTENESLIRGKIYIRGYWPQNGYRHQRAKVEVLPVVANAPFTSRNMYRSIKSIEARGIDPNAYVRVKVLDFGAKWKSDSIGEYWSQIRTDPAQRVFWQLVGKDTAFSGIVQPEYRTLPGATDECYLARTSLLTDTIYDQDLEWNVLETWRLTDTAGTALSGLVDIAPVPNSRFILALGRDSKAWVIDTYRTAVNMRGFGETTMSPIRIRPTWPKDSSQTPSLYTVKLDTYIKATADGVQRWRWIVHHAGTIDIIQSSGVTYPFASASGWQYGSDDRVIVPGIDFVVSGNGEYIFELEMMTDNGTRYQTYAGFQRVEKRALAELPIRGLTQAPSGIEFDSYGRPWVSVGTDDAVRLVMRTDIAAWVPEERVLLTREPYDEVRKTY